MARHFHINEDGLGTCDGGFGGTNKIRRDHEFMCNFHHAAGMDHADGHGMR